jgi:hypothetical protein
MAKTKRYAVSEDGLHVMNTHTGRTVLLPQGVRAQLAKGTPYFSRREAVRDFVAEKNGR